MHEYKLYPEYAIKEEYKKHSELKRLQQNKLKALREALAEGKTVKVISKLLLPLPTHESHSCHPTGIVAGPAQKVHHLISRKIEELVQEGATNVNKIQRALRQHVKSHCSTSMSSPTDRAYYPTTTDIRNHMYFSTCSEDTLDIVAQLVRSKEETIDIKVMNTAKQTGKVDCALFAMANVTCLVLGCDPVNISNNNTPYQDFKSLETRKITAFPVIKKQRLKS